MRYCPVDGDEYLDSVTRCPDHDVELVDEEPNLPEAMSWVERLNDRLAMRVAFILFFLAATVYAVAGTVAGLLIALDPLKQSHFERSFQFSTIQEAAFPLAIAALGVMIAALALRGYLEPGELRVTADADEMKRPSTGEGPMRLLFALVVVFALLWAGTSIAISRERSGPQELFQEEQANDTYITLSALNYSAYSVGTSCLAIMGASLIMRAYRRMAVATNLESPGSTPAPDGFG